MSENIIHKTLTATYASHWSLIHVKGSKTPQVYVYASSARVSLESVLLELVA